MASEKKDSIVCGEIDGSMASPRALFREAIAEDAVPRYEMIKEGLTPSISDLSAKWLSA
jgi:hypothetical protein